MSNVAPSKKGKNGKMVKRWSQIYKNFAIFWVVVSSVFYFHPYLGKWSNLTNIFQRGWNQQLVVFLFTCQVCLQSLGPTDRHVLKQLLQDEFFHLGNYRVVTKKILRYQHWNSPGCLFSFVDFSIEEETKRWNLWSIAKKDRIHWSVEWVVMGYFKHVCFEASIC